MADDSVPPPPELAGVARTWYIGGLVVDEAVVAMELAAEYRRLPANQRTLSTAVQIVASRRKIPSVPAQVDSGPELFKATVEAVRKHYFFESEWHYFLVALFILQARIVSSLPAVFYLFFGGRYGTGKTNILRLIADLTDGILLENVSVTALARVIESGRVVCIDEFDVPRGREVDEMRDALVRQGYKATAAPYSRWDPTRKQVEKVPIYGPKVLAFRGSIDDALQSRGLLIPTATPTGEEAYDLVIRNLYPELKGIPVRTQLWGLRARVEYPPERVQQIAESPEFRAKVRSVVHELGANRDSELMTVALLTAEVAGVDVLGALRTASELRDTTAAQSADDALSELTEVVVDLAKKAPRPLSEDSGFTQLKQSDIAAEVNRRRRAVGKPALASARFATCRRELGVKDTWLQAHHKAAFWNLPAHFLATLETAADGVRGSAVGSPTSPAPPARQGGAGDRRSLGNQPPIRQAHPPLPVGPDPGDLFRGRPTRADLLRCGGDKA